MMVELKGLPYVEITQRTDLFQTRRLKIDLLHDSKMFHQIEEVHRINYFQINTGKNLWDCQGHNYQLKKEYSRLDVREYFFT